LKYFIKVVAAAFFGEPRMFSCFKFGSTLPATYLVILWLLAIRKIKIQEVNGEYEQLAVLKSCYAPVFQTGVLHILLCTRGSLTLICAFLCESKVVLQQKEFGLVAMWSLLRLISLSAYLK